MIHPVIQLEAAGIDARVDAIATALHHARAQAEAEQGCALDLRKIEKLAQDDGFVFRFHFQRKA